MNNIKKDDGIEDNVNDNNIVDVVDDDEDINHNQNVNDDKSNNYDVDDDDNNEVTRRKKEKKKTLSFFFKQHKMKFSFLLVYLLGLLSCTILSILMNNIDMITDYFIISSQQEEGGGKTSRTSTRTSTNGRNKKGSLSAGTRYDYKNDDYKGYMNEYDINDDSLSFHGMIARPYKLWPVDEYPVPCVEPPEGEHPYSPHNRKDTGLLFVKPMKVGGSTASGIQLRIAERLPVYQNLNFTRCRITYGHNKGENFQYRNKSKSFLWTMLRHPTKRIVSQFFHFSVSRQKMEPTDTNFKERLENAITVKNYYIKLHRFRRDWNNNNNNNNNNNGTDTTMTTISASEEEVVEEEEGDDLAEDDNNDNNRAMEATTMTTTTTQVDVQQQQPPPNQYQQNNHRWNEIDDGNQILSEYDFIAITERYDESIVVMQLLLGLDTIDVMYLNAKGSGGFDDGGKRYGCTFIVPSFVSSGMQEYFNSSEYQEKIQYDLALYHAANKSLDLTIDYVIGRHKFDIALKQFRYALSIVQSECISEAIFPCSSGGEKQHNSNCLFSDQACGNDCVTRIMEEINP